MRQLLPVLFLAVLASCTQDAEPPADVVEQTVTLDVGELTIQRAKDQRMITALASNGSDLDQPHRLEHHLVCPSPDAVGQILAWATEHGYEATELSHGEFEGRSYTHFDLIREAVPTLANISPQTTDMLTLAAKYGVEYDGWGCEVVE